MENPLLAAIRARHCKRAFLDRPVPRGILEAVLRAAAHAPSTRNIQPWQVVVLEGAARDGLSRRLCEDFDRGLPPRPDYANRPPVLDAALEERARAWGAGMYGTLGIAREDGAARRDWQRQNFLFYGAPVEMILHLPANAAPGTFLEAGLFLQNVMLGLAACGLGSCPQYSVAGYSETIRSYLGLGRDRLIVCGLAVGYPDASAPINGYVPARAPLEAYVRWLDHAPSSPGTG